MNLRPALRPRRPFPVADRSRDGVLYETEHPRIVALREAREKILSNRAGLDPYDRTVFVLVARPHETVFLGRMLGLIGVVLDSRPEPGGGCRYRAVLEADARGELHLDTVHAPLMADEPLASRGVDAPAEAILHVLHPERRLAIAPEPDPQPSQFRPAMERARQLAALRVDCGCGAPTGVACRCDDATRLATAAANGKQVH